MISNSNLHFFTSINIHCKNITWRILWWKIYKTIEFPLEENFGFRNNFLSLLFFSILLNEPEVEINKMEFPFNM